MSARDAVDEDGIFGEFKAEFKRQFDYEEIGPALKRRLIETENKLWKAKQKELARK